MKKLFTLLFVIVATTALWAEDFEVNGIYYNKNKTFNVQRTEKSERVDIILSGALPPRKNQLGGIKAALILLKRGYDVHVSLIGYDNLVQDYATECRDEIEKSKYYNPDFVLDKEPSEDKFKVTYRKFENNFCTFKDKQTCIKGYGTRNQRL